MDLLNVNPACGHKEVPGSTGHIVVTTHYSDQQGFKSRQKVMRLYKQWHRPISKRPIKPPYSISRATSIDSDCCRLPTISSLSNKDDKLRSNHFDQQVQVSQGHTWYKNKENLNTEVHAGGARASIQPSKALCTLEKAPRVLPVRRSLWTS